MRAPAPSGGRDARARGGAPDVLIVDDHDLFRAGLRTLLEGAGMRVVGDVRCEDAAVDMARRVRPTVALVDAQRVDGTPTDSLIGRIDEALEHGGIVVFAGSSGERDVYRAVRAGARGYVMKDAPVEELAAAVRAVHTGTAWLTADVAATVIGFIRTGRVPSLVEGGVSDREVEVLRLLARGLDNNEIAADLGISAKTVKNHVSSIYSKLGLANRVQAAVHAVRTGIV